MFNCERDELRRRTGALADGRGEFTPGFSFLPKSLGVLSCERETAFDVRCQQEIGESGPHIKTGVRLVDPALHSAAAGRPHPPNDFDETHPRLWLSCHQSGDATFDKLVTIR